MKQYPTILPKTGLSILKIPTCALKSDVDNVQLLWCFKLQDDDHMILLINQSYWQSSDVYIFRIKVYKFINALLFLCLEVAWECFLCLWSILFLSSPWISLNLLDEILTSCQEQGCKKEKNINSAKMQTSNNSLKVPFKTSQNILCNTNTMYWVY